jgi:alpha-1,2-mannosyltransferase
VPVVAYLSLGLARLRPGSRRLAGGFALAAASLWLEPVHKTLLFGQLNLLLLVAVMVDFAPPRQRRWMGVGVGIAAGIKLTPLIFIPYLLLSRRPRAALVALLTFAVTAVLGFVLLPADSIAYWAGKFATPGDGPERLVNQSIFGVVQRAVHGGTGALVVWLAVVALTGAGGMVTAVIASWRGRELLGIVVCGVTGLLISPISWTHHWVYVIPGLALAVSGVPRSWRVKAARLAAAAVGAGLFAVWPARSGPNGYYDPRAALVPRGLLRFVVTEGTQGPARGRTVPPICTPTAAWSWASYDAQIGMICAVR